MCPFCDVTRYRHCFNGRKHTFLFSCLKRFFFHSASPLRMRRSYDLHLLNWQLSVFWAFAGIVSVATCVSSTNRRLRAEVGQLSQRPVAL